MKLSNEEIAKVFAMYIGCDFVFSQSSKSLTSTGVTPNWVYDLHQDKYVIGACKLLLTPLSEITDEHAVEVFRVAHAILPDCSMETKISEGRYIAEEIGNPAKRVRIPWMMQQTVFVNQYLISCSYAVPLFFAPNHWANGKTAIELGIGMVKP